MRSIRVPAAAGLLAVLLGTAGFAAEPASTITVMGDGTIDAPPDIFILTVGAHVRDKDLLTARNKVGDVAGRIVKAVKGFPIDRARSYTNASTISPTYEGRELVGYDVTQTMRLALSDIRQAEELTVATIKAGANVIQSMEFTVKNIAELQDQARDKSAANALERAKSVAKVLGYAPDRPLSITTYDSAYVVMGCRWDNVPLDPAAGGNLRDEDRFHLISPTNAKVQARVQVQFSIKPLSK